jgi:hypothetical protein
VALIPYSQRKQNPTPSRGGTGSFSYADTKVYAPGGQPMSWLQQRWRIDSNTGAVIDNGKTIWLPQALGISSIVLPGQGGGAKLPGKRVYGGGAFHPDASTTLGAGPGPNPNGFVLIRLMTVD